jgi:Rod binding domain-containing protein
MNGTMPIATATVATDQPAQPQPRLVKAAHEFEAQMMKEMLKPMTASGSLTGGDEDSDADSGSGSALGEFASEALGRALSERGGFGIATKIIGDLSRSGRKTSTPPGEGRSPPIRHSVS